MFCYIVVSFNMTRHEIYYLSIVWSKLNRTASMLCLVVH
jgi:hypothetical protein